MKIRMLLSLAAVSLSLGGCAVVQSPSTGLIYTGVQGPVAVGEATTTGKTGQSCVTNILGLISVGDASIDAAKKAGGITKVSSVDASSTDVLLVYGQYCTVVRGE